MTVTIPIERHEHYRWPATPGAQTDSGLDATDPLTPSHHLPLVAHGPPEEVGALVRRPAFRCTVHQRHCLTASREEQLDVIAGALASSLFAAVLALQFWLLLTAIA